MKEKHKKALTLLSRDLPVPSYVCILISSFIATVALCYFIVILSELILIGSMRMDGGPPYIPFVSYFPQLIAFLFGLLVAFGIYSLGIHLAFPKSSVTNPQSVETQGDESSLPKQPENAAAPSFSQEELSLLREIRDYLKEQEHHE